jgi:general secretion pathway protein D
VRWSALVATAAVAILSACSSVKKDIQSIDQIDPTMNLNREDYRNLAAPKKGSEDSYAVSVAKDAPPIPKLEDILAAPRPPKIGETQLVSIAVTDDVPLKDVLLELAKLADVDIELDAGISGGISFIAKDKPFNEVIDRIADLANLRYSMKDGVLRVERDTPYIKSYPIDFLNMDRDSDSSVNLSTNVLSSSGGGSSSGGSSGGGSSGGGSSGGGGGSGGGSGGLNTGSTSSVKSKTSGDFWKSLEAGVLQILAYQAPQHLSDTTLQAETDANVVPPGAGGAPKGGAAAAAAAATTAAAATASSTAGAGAAAGGGGATTAKNYTINRQAGVLTLNATAKQHELVQRLLETLKKNASAQVLIEAKIIEVDLNDQYASGIDWNTLGTNLSKLGLGSINASFPIASPASPIVNPSTSFVTFTTQNSKAIMTLIEAFGTVRTLSSPRLHAINNQQSTLTFAENHVYFTLQITPATTTTTGSVSTTPTAPTITSSTQTVPIGVMMTMMPSIDLENNEVTLSVRPTLSTIIDSVDDPAFELNLAVADPALAGTLHNLIPEVQVRELDSTLKLKSGETMVIGGLMQQEATNTDQGIPFASSVPLLGNLFKNVAKSSHNKELVLLIKATIVNSAGDLNKTDATIFHKFSNDPRPVSF